MKIPPRNLFGVPHFAKLLDIDADFARPRNRNERDITRMRHIESQFAALMNVAQPRLPVVIQDNRNPVRRRAEIPSQEHAQRAARDHKPPSRRFQSKFFRASPFVRRKYLAQFAELRISHVQPHFPNMRFIRCNRHRGSMCWLVVVHGCVKFAARLSRRYHETDKLPLPTPASCLLPSHHTLSGLIENT